MRADPYQRIARWYDRILEPFNAALRRKAMTLTPPRAGMKVLEVGCGTGTFLELYQGGGCEVFGLDLSPSMLDVARQKLGDRAQLHLGDAAQMPYEADSFDLVLMAFTLHEMPPDTRVKVLEEAHRILRQEGRVLILDFHRGAVRFPMGWLNKVGIFFVEFLAGGEHFRNYRQFMATGGIPSMMSALPFTIEQEKIVSAGNLGLYLLRPSDSVSFNTLGNN